MTTDTMTAVRDKAIERVEDTARIVLGILKEPGLNNPSYRKLVDAQGEYKIAVDHLFAVNAIIAAHITLLNKVEREEGRG